MATCCGQNNCGCSVVDGPGITVEGTGSLSDPYTISDAFEKVEALGTATGLWVGSQAEYDALGVYSPTVVYVIPEE